MIDRTQRPRFANYKEQVDALGLWLWLRLKWQGLRMRLASPGEEVLVRTPLATYPLVVRAKTSDVSVFGQIFIHREYRCLDHVNDAGLIVDCGANVGYSTAYLLTRFPRATVIAIEPHEGNFPVLRENVRRYGDRCVSIQAAVWSSSVGLSVSDAKLGDRREWSVKVRPAAPEEEPSVMAVDLGSVLDESGFDRISILKVDIEGSEEEVFRTNTESWIDRVDHLVIEFHGEDCRDTVFNAVASLGFDVSECEELTVFSKRARG